MVRLKRFFKSLKDEIFHYGNVPEYYNERRLHFSLDIDNGETPLMAFSNKKATASIRKENPKWMESNA